MVIKTVVVDSVRRLGHHHPSVKKNKREIKKGKEERRKRKEEMNKPVSDEVVISTCKEARRARERYHYSLSSLINHRKRGRRREGEIGEDRGRMYRS